MTAIYFTGIIGENMRVTGKRSFRDGVSSERISYSYGHSRHTIMGGGFVVDFVFVELDGEFVFPMVDAEYYDEVTGTYKRELGIPDIPEVGDEFDNTPLQYASIIDWTPELTDLSRTCSPDGWYDDEPDSSEDEPDFDVIQSHLYRCTLNDIF